ncbi:MAG TPA: outer membrane beta-barrel protein [Thermoanaerobaculia bacterium]|nr:outer membrane beta-barrel protein [Thermoanaerobaculia bacterium]
MKKALILIAVAAVAFGGSAASASDFAVFGSYLDTEDLDQSVGAGVRAGFGNRFQLDLRASYFPDLSEDFESFVDDPGTDPGRFQNDVEAIPLDAGLKLNFNPEEGWNPYVGGGATYWFLDLERGEVDDEAGFYLAGGIEFARPTGGVGFFAEAIYRDVEATVNRDPNDFDDLDDVDFEAIRQRDLDVGGIGVNAGLIWKF